MQIDINSHAEQPSKPIANEHRSWVDPGLIMIAGGRHGVGVWRHRDVSDVDKYRRYDAVWFGELKARRPVITLVPWELCQLAGTQFTVVDGIWQVH